MAMRIDLPLCNFKNCRFSFDGNCKSQDLYDKCDLRYFVEQKHGEWKAHTFTAEDGEEYVGSYECSNCGLFTGPVKLNFCPNCGADMRRADNG